MTSGYYIEEPRAEWESVQRWENEGGRLGQNQDLYFESDLAG